MRLTSISLTGILPHLCLFLVAFSLHAQKLPRVQQESLFAPSTVAVDGKANEWNNIFKAYNNKTEVFYSISNDLNVLYITLQATNPDICKKIIVGGITFSFSESNEKQKSMAITFPAYNKLYPALNLTINRLPLTKNDTLRNKMLADSIMKAHNNKLQAKLKLIEVLGVKEIQDSILSVYNEKGIRVAALFDNKQALTYEIGIPLRYLGIDRGNKQQLYYDIKLNGLYRGISNLYTVNSERGERLMYVRPDGLNMYIGILTPQTRVLSYPTNFSGEYRLATK